jgi:ABC-type dipeptide/oligopeptide/nickel transport system permease component
MVHARCHQSIEVVGVFKEKMEIKNLHMKNLKKYIQNLRFKTFFLFYVICMINVMFANSSKHIFKNGYHFFYSFFSILPVYMLGIVIMLRLVYQLEGPPRSPFHLLKYSFYFIILSLSSFLIYFLWGMRHVISHLKW